jgi:hypothetical protein
VGRGLVRTQRRRLHGVPTARMRSLRRFSTSVSRRIQGPPAFDMTREGLVSLRTAQPTMFPILIALALLFDFLQHFDSSTSSRR